MKVFRYSVMALAMLTFSYCGSEKTPENTEALMNDMNGIENAEQELEQEVEKIEKEVDDLNQELDSLLNEI